MKKEMNLKNGARTWSSRTGWLSWRPSSRLARRRTGRVELVERTVLHRLPGGGGVGCRSRSSVLGVLAARAEVVRVPHLQPTARSRGLASDQSASPSVTGGGLAVIGTR